MTLIQMNPADENVRVPADAPEIPVRVIALHRGTTPGAFRYLQGIRQGTLRVLNPDPEQTEAALLYHAQKHRFFSALAAKMGFPIDAILSPPSRFPEQAEPYRKAIAAAHPDAFDLTDRFIRIGTSHAGERATLSDVLNGLDYRPVGREKDFRCPVIVDDTFSIGTTAAAIVKLLRSHGLTEDCQVIVACPLWLDTPKSATTPKAS